MFSDPDKNIEHLGLMPGMKVADFGAGSGFYSFAASRCVGGSGKVYVVDVQKELLTKLQNNARNQKLLNIEILWGDIEKLGGALIREASIDAVIVANILFQVEHKENVLKEIFRILKPKGKVLVVDWVASFGGIGPHPDHVFPEAKAISLFEAGEFVKIKRFSAGAQHYGIIFQKK